MSYQNVFNRIRQFDAYPKTLEDFRVKTYGGATVTIVSGIIMFILFVSELNYYLTKEVMPELYVDTTRGEKLQINVDVTFPSLPCGYISIDAMDVAGEQQLDVATNMFKKRLDKLGKPVARVERQLELGDGTDDDEIEKLDPNRCESCYGAETKELSCCNTCEDVREAYRRKGWAFNFPKGIVQCEREGWSDKLKAQQGEGCQVFGHLEVNKVAGNFHFAPGKSFQQHHVHVHDLQPFSGEKFNLSHQINHLSFGNSYPGMENPLDNTKVMADKGAGSKMYQYFVKIVPTTYTKISGRTTRSNQFSCTKHEKVVTTSLAASSGEHGLPGVFILYEFAPLMVKYTEKHRSFMHFITGVCAIIGGVFTVAGIVDSMIYHSSKAIQKKIDLGKAT